MACFFGRNTIPCRAGTGRCCGQNTANTARARCCCTAACTGAPVARCGGTALGAGADSRLPTGQAAQASAPCTAGTGAVADEFYLGRVPRVVRTTCCDPLCGCREFLVQDRNSFWPSFAHPRWLRCSELYRGRTRR